MLRQVSRTHVFVGLIALGVYLPGFWWGVPSFADRQRSHSWSVDAAVPLGPLAEMHNIVEPKPNRNLGYPLMHSFIVSAAYTPYLAYAWVSGQFTHVSAVYPFGLTDPERSLTILTLIAHLVSVVMGVVIVLASYDAARVLWDRSTALLASFFAMLSFPMFYYTRTGNVDVPVLCFTALALAAFARMLASGVSLQRATWLGIFVGGALATKEPSLASFIAIPFVMLWLLYQQGETRWRSLQAWRIPLATAMPPRPACHRTTTARLPWCWATSTATATSTWPSGTASLTTGSRTGST